MTEIQRNTDIIDPEEVRNVLRADDPKWIIRMARRMTAPNVNFEQFGQDDFLLIRAVIGYLAEMEQGADQHLEEIHSDAELEDLVDILATVTHLREELAKAMYEYGPYTRRGPVRYIEECTRDAAKQVIYDEWTGTPGRISA